MPKFSEEDIVIIEEYTKEIKNEISVNDQKLFERPGNLRPLLASDGNPVHSRPVELNIAYARYLKMLKRNGFKIHRMVPYLRQYLSPINYQTNYEESQIYIDMSILHDSLDKYVEQIINLEGVSIGNDKIGIDNYWKIWKFLKTDMFVDGGIYRPYGFDTTPYYTVDKNSFRDYRLVVDNLHEYALAVNIGEPPPDVFEPVFVEEILSPGVPLQPQQPESEDGFETPEGQPLPDSAGQIQPGEEIVAPAGQNEDTDDEVTAVPQEQAVSEQPESDGQIRSEDGIEAPVDEIVDTAVQQQQTPVEEIQQSQQTPMTD
jgi:hypothetical protein